jgi:hypothetical protein
MFEGKQYYEHDDYDHQDEHHGYEKHGNHKRRRGFLGHIIDF